MFLIIVSKSEEN